MTGQGAKSKSTLTRTSKQAWLADQYYAFDVALPDGNVTKEIVYMSSDMKRIFPLPENHLDYRVVYDSVAYRVSLRIQNATELLVNGPFSSEQYQVINNNVLRFVSAQDENLGLHSICFIRATLSGLLWRLVYFHNEIWGHTSDFRI